MVISKSLRLLVIKILLYFILPAPPLAATNKSVVVIEKFAGENMNQRNDFLVRPGQGGGGGSQGEKV